MKIGPRVGLMALLMFGCGGMEPAEERQDPEPRQGMLQDRHPTRIVLDRAGPVLDEDTLEGLKVQELDNAEVSPGPISRVDLSKEQLYSNEVCGGKRCPAVDKPCEARAMGPQVVCICEHEGYQFPCR